MGEMKPCFQCGSDPTEVEWTNVIEHSGFSSQSAMMGCSGENRADCPVDVIISVNADEPINTNKIEGLLVKMWNELGNL